MEQQKITIVKRDTERIIDLVTTIIGLAALAYAIDPEPFDRIRDETQARVRGLIHRLSVWDTRRSIRSLPETDDPNQ